MRPTPYAYIVSPLFWSFDTTPGRGDVSYESFVSHIINPARSSCMKGMHAARIECTLRLSYGSAGYRCGLTGSLYTPHEPIVKPTYVETLISTLV